MSAIPAFVNPHAGSAARAHAALHADARFDVRELAPGLVAAAIHAAAEGGARRALVSGGDGTIGAALGAAAATGLELAILPGGTRNHFARDLGLPVDDLAAVLDVAATGAAAPTDLGYVNGHPMVNTSAVGTYVDFVRRREARQARLGYALASVAAAVGVWRHGRAVDVELRAGDGGYRRYRTPLLFVGVGERILGPRGLGMRRPGGARALHVLVVRARARSRVAALAATAVARGFDDVGDVDDLDAYLVAETVAVMARPRGTIAVDGEVVEATSPLRYELRRDAALVVRP